MAELGGLLLALIDDLAAILNTNKFFSLESWLSSARAAAGDEESRALFEFNARNQVTLWGPDGLKDSFFQEFILKGEISDYASKAWGGLYATYYRARWALFLEALRGSLRARRPFDEAAFAAAALRLEEVSSCFTPPLFFVHLLRLYF